MKMVVRPNWRPIPAALAFDSLEPRLCLAADVPVPRLDAGPVNTPGGVAYDFIAAFSHNYLLDERTLDANDMLVTGPNGFAQKATLVEVMPGDFTTWARYRIVAPGGAWDSADNGTYTISLLPDQVFDRSGNAISAATLGTFTVNVPLAGDANRDGVVNDSDFQIVRANFGKTEQMTWDTGDFNADGTVSFADFQILEANFGKSQPAPAASAIAPTSPKLVPVAQPRPRPIVTGGNRSRLLN